MALHTDTEIYKATYALCQLVTQLVAGMPRNYKADFGADLRKGHSAAPNVWAQLAPREVRPYMAMVQRATDNQQQPSA